MNNQIILLIGPALTVVNLTSLMVVKVVMVVVVVTMMKTIMINKRRSEDVKRNAENMNRTWLS